MKNSIAQRRRQRHKEIADGVRDQKREHILQIAEDLFFTRGYAGTTIAGIVERLGVTKPYLYYYFDSKQDIFETLCWRASVACLTALHFEVDDERPAADKLREGLQRFADANISHFKSGTFAYRESAALQPALKKKLRALARRFYGELYALLEEGKREGALDFENTKLTGLAIGSMAGFMYTWYKPGGTIPPQQMTEELTAILLKIAGAREKKARPAAKNSATPRKRS